MQSDTMTMLILSLLAVFAGACLATQAPVNTRLAMGLGYPVLAAAISFTAGAIVLGCISFITIQTSSVSPGWGNIAWPFYIAGGCLGTVYVVMAIFLIPRIGATALMGLAITGQLLAGLIIDKTGFLGVTVREITLGRISGVILLIVGVILIRKY